MKKNYKILRIISSINPEFGGPSKTVIETSLALCNQGFKVDIITSDSKNSNFYKSKKIKIINKGPRIGKYDFNINTHGIGNIDFYYINNLYKQLIKTYEQDSLNIILYLINSYIYINKETLIILYDYYKKYQILKNDLIIDNIIDYLINSILITKNIQYIKLILGSEEFKYIMDDLKNCDIDEYNKIMSKI